LLFHFVPVFFFLVSTALENPLRSLSGHILAYTAGQLHKAAQSGTENRRHFLVLFLGFALKSFKDHSVVKFLPILQGNCTKEHEMELKTDGTAEDATLETK